MGSRWTRDVNDARCATSFMAMVMGMVISVVWTVPVQATPASPGDALFRCWDGQQRAQFIACIHAIASTLEPIDPMRRDDFGELYDPKAWEACVLEAGCRRMPNDSACEIYRLRRLRNPEYWPAGTPPVQWPSRPVSATVSSTDSASYFRALCQREAGDFIFRTVPNVEAVFDARPRAVENDIALQDRYAVEDPFGYSAMGDIMDLGGNYVQPPTGPYRRFERMSDDGSVLQFYRGEPTGQVVNYMVPAIEQGAYEGRTVPHVVHRRQVAAPSARYAVTWRGVDRPIDRRLGIAGGELAIVDMSSGEVLALRRNFVRSGTGQFPKFWWPGAESCPEVSYEKNGRRIKKPALAFVREVLLPVND